MNGGMNVSNLVVVIAILSVLNCTLAVRAHWSYECQKSRCERIELLDEKTAISLPVCRLFCGEHPGTLWPRINGKVNLEGKMARLTPNAVQFNFINKTERNEIFWQANEQRLREQILAKVPNYVKIKNDDTGAHLMIMIDVENEDGKLGLNTNEGYHIQGYENIGVVIIKIKAETIFGARHAIETISQLIVYDDIRHEFQIVCEFEIEDKPVFPHRGFLLDTSRNYFTVDSIKRTIDAMAMVKLNVFHWHMIDSQSFPLVLKSHPDLSEIGAYAPDKVYTIDDINKIYEYAYVRGVLLLPEFDAPAHVGEGWQHKNVTACFNAQPWVKYCVEPPCGQLDPTKENLYDILEDIYREMYDAFRKPDIIHMGGDEVSHSCWNSSKEIQDWMLQKGWGLNQSDFMKLWGHFQDNALERMDKVTGKKIPIIMWTSHLTEVPYVEQYLDKQRYIIQIWTTGADPKITDLLKRGYKLILSNYDGLYLDCGFGAWVTEGNNWCSPYIGWEKVYKNNFTQFGSNYKSQFYGAEAALWSEQTDHHTLDGRIWPRLSALAERLWSDPSEHWRSAEPRMLIHRERLVDNGIAAESLQPQWCLYHEGECPID